MPSQEITIGELRLASNDNLYWQPTGDDENLPVESFLWANSDDELWFAYLQIPESGDGTACYLYFADSATALGHLSRPSLNSEILAYENAITIRAGDLEVVIPGPDHISNESRDNTEPYVWTASAAKLTEIMDFSDDYLDLTDDEKAGTVLILDDGRIAPTLSLSDQSSSAAADFSYQHPAAESGVSPYTYVASDTLPAGITYDAATRTFSGMTVKEGEFALRYGHGRSVA